MALFDNFKKTKSSLNENEVSYSESKKFDLNIEKILENWDIYHAIREIIANAIDEQKLTNTKDISIFKDGDGWWHIVDYGRGLNYHHLTQNENEEKLKNENLIGKFGVGLKDALATLFRNNIKIKIISKYGVIMLKKAVKTGFNDITTLHAEIFPAANSNMIGTDFCLFGCNDQDIFKAKKLFLKFSDKNILETTEYGQIIENTSDIAEIYINGVKVAEEPNFLFSYNITSLTKQIKKALNRERLNVGRSAYTSRIKDILKSSNSELVNNKLINDFQKYGSGNEHDELSWSEISMHASILLNKKNKNSTFISTEELEEQPELVDWMKRSGYNPVVVPKNIIEKMEEYNDNLNDNQETLKTSFQYLKEEEKKINKIPVDLNCLTYKEKQVYEKTNEIFNLIGGKPKNVKQIIIVEEIYETNYFDEVLGLWIGFENKILIKRSQLNSLEEYASTLLHECAHALSGMPDVNRDFERKLTDIIGILSIKILK